jgi:hypothetical protein
VVTNTANCIRSWKCRITAASFAGFEDCRWVGRLADPEYSRELALAGNWRSVLSAPNAAREVIAACLPREVRAAARV